MRLEVEEDELPWVHFSKPEVKKYRKGQAKEYTMTVFALQDLFPREQLLYFIDGMGNRADFVISQPACPFSECKNYLAYWAKANLRTYSASGGEFAVEPSMANASQWGSEESDEFGGLFAPPSSFDEFTQWRLEKGKFIYGIPSFVEPDAKVIFRVSLAGYESVGYKKERKTGRKWETVIRYKFIREGDGGGLMIMARYVRDGEDASEYFREEYWKRPEVIGSAVVRYLPALGNKYKGKTFELRSVEGHYWAAVGYNLEFSQSEVGYSGYNPRTDYLAIRPTIVGVVGEK